ncbi:hypothetical protein Drose_04425 [Dactylosporangium roseum]|uniref:HNH endonuclease n=1 Tax=Dactylosporangium roseum TaxID=47989 RepID=A0ABY5Z652_9ACTN|nr:hypothetical protein [Dactylosporangium roseum]UWZ37536.1 hypothetical protein Drose_04425 [Dactylosporangium roseum]
MKRREPAKRRTPLKSGKPLERKTSIRRSTPMQEQARSESPSARKAAPKKRRRSTVELRAALALRSGGVCEIQQEGCQGRAVEPCHRIKTGMGGVHGAAIAESDRLSNCVHGCRWCGRWQHDHEPMAKAYGQILSRSADPLKEPILLRYGVVFLDDEGGWELCPPATAREIREAQRRREATNEDLGYGLADVG